MVNQTTKGSNDELVKQNLVDHASLNIFMKQYLDCGSEQQDYLKGHPYCETAKSKEKN
jgi:hypothetical protein